MITFAPAMYIKPQKKWRKSVDGSVMVPYTYYRLCESYRGEGGHSCQHMICGLGELEQLHTNEERKELARLLDGMLSRGEYLMSEREDIYELALSIYTEYRETREKERLQAIEDKRLKEEVARKEEERKRNLVTVSWKSLHVTEARSIGAEHVCREMLDRLGITSFLTSQGWRRHDVAIACMQIVARAIYPYSEYRTVSYLRENSALCEMFGIEPESITKDKLYDSARRLYSVHREMEDYLHKRVCGMFGIEEKIYLFDITNMYAEGVYGNSLIFQYGRSKEKRNDLKVVVLAAVVNTDGLLVRTEIYEGNMQDVKTLEGMIGSLEKGLTPGRRVIVMDAGFSSIDNLEWLRANGYDYVTVMRSAGIRYTPVGEVSDVYDNKHQHIRLQLVSVDGTEDRVLMVDSDAKAMKEHSMHKKLSARFEEGLEAIRSGIEGKGTKKRDKVNNRLGRLYNRYPGMERMYDITITYNDKDKATSIEWKKKDGAEEQKQAFHGKYFLQSSLDESDANNIWEFYNVIRTVEETFKTLKSDLDIRPIYHKSDDGAKAHLNLAVLAYWIVSCVKYRLKQAKINVRWEELLRIMSTQVRVSVSAVRDNGNTITTRKSTEPEEKLTEIYDSLGISHKPMCSAKFVWHLKPPLKNNDY